MAATPSISFWIQELKKKDEQAATEIWNRYFHKLVALARHKLGNIAPRVIDPEDVAISVFESLCKGAVEGNFPLLSDSEDLWKLLVTITHQKAVNHIRHTNARKRGGGMVRGDSVFFSAGSNEDNLGFEGFKEDAPTPDFFVILEDQFEHLLTLLRTDELRQIALLLLEGQSSLNIAKELNVSKRTVQRKIKVILDDWKSELNAK